MPWFGHVRREGEEGVLRKVERMQVIKNRRPGRPNGTLDQLVQRDMKKKGLKEEQAMYEKERTAGENDDNENNLFL